MRLMLHKGSQCLNMYKHARVSNKSVGTLLLLRSCITRANFRLAKLEKAEFTYRK